ncbi:hypothetical protein LJR066_006625 [Acidovorax sp. LjRoot66]|uniref:hypothetical protein n=1 Tax=Acidovorax sp. LjRoot66 TaxID=3342334 RepID=UPI003ED035FA
MQANPRQTLGIQTNAQVHFDSEREVNLVVSQDKSSGAWKVYGDTQRIVSKVSRDGVTNLDSDTIQYLNYLIGAASGVSAHDLPSRLDMAGLRISVHQPSSSGQAFTVPLGSFDVNQAQDIESRALKVASSTTCCASGTCDFILGCDPWGA